MGSVFSFGAVILCLITEILLLVALLRRGRRLRNAAETAATPGFGQGSGGFGRSGNRSNPAEPTASKITFGAPYSTEALGRTLPECCCAFCDTAADRR